MFTGISVFNNNGSVNRADNLKDNLKEFAVVNGERITERKKQTFNVALSMKSRGEEEQNDTLIKRAERSLNCASYRYVGTVDGQAQTLFTHRCKGRHCQECQRIKAYIWQKKIESIFPDLQKNHLCAKYIFATFTIKNPKLTDLRVVLSIMNKAANRMFKMVKYKRFILGGVRSTEITRGKSGGDECHPHFHFLLMVKGNYGKKYYVSQHDWGTDWGDCLAYECDKAGYEYNATDYPRGFPIVDIVRAMDKDKKIEITNKNIEKSGSAIINYVLKYSVKGVDILDKSKGKNDNWFFEFDKQIKGSRMITPVGVFKDYLGLIKKEPFDYEEEKEKINKRLGDKREVNKVIFKQGDYKLENLKNSDEYEVDALDAKAYNFQQYYISIYSDYIKFFHQTNAEILDLEGKLEQEYNLSLDVLRCRLLLIQNGRREKLDRTIKSLCRVGYLKLAGGLYFDEDGKVWYLFEPSKYHFTTQELEAVNAQNEADEQIREEDIRLYKIELRKEKIRKEAEEKMKKKQRERKKQKEKEIEMERQKEMEMEREREDRIKKE